MKTQKRICNTLPAYIYDFTETTCTSNKFVTTAKLKVFYQGTTQDKRTFTEEFSNKLLETLPSTPIVGYYSEEDEDFLGHNSEQYVYGYVPETASYGFETDDTGTKWAVTDVILFTGRQDNIGKIASKIVGKQHSLELDPDSIKYDMVVNDKGYLQEIIFRDGSLVGLSVLGDEESPAFKGSGFFISQEVQNIIREFASLNDMNTIKSGGQKMNIFENLTEKEIQFLSTFLNKTFSEVMTEYCDKFRAVDKDYEYYVVDVYSNGDLITYNFNDGEYYKMYFSNDTYSLDSKDAVKRYYLTSAEVSTLENAASTVANAEENPVVEITPNESDNSFAEEDKKDEEEEKDEDNNEEKDEDDDDNKDMADKKDKESKCAELKEGEHFVETNESKESAKENTNFAALNDEERRELETYRASEKKQIVEKYSKYLTKEEKQEILNKLSDYTRESLNSALAVKMAQIVLSEQEQEHSADINRSGIFQIMGDANTAKDTTVDLVNKYK